MENFKIKIYTFPNCATNNQNQTQSVIGLGDIARGGGPEPTSQTEKLCPSIKEGSLAKTDLGQDGGKKVECEGLNLIKSSGSESTLGNVSEAQPIGQGDLTTFSTSFSENFTPNLSTALENRDPMGGRSQSGGNKGTNRPRQAQNDQKKIFHDKETPRPCTASPRMTPLGMVGMGSPCWRWTRFRGRKLFAL